MGESSVTAAVRPSFPIPKRTLVRISEADAVRKTTFEADGFLALIEAAMPIDLAAWASANLARLEGELVTHGAILFRGFAIASAAAFRQFASTISPDLVDYSERAAPRLQVAGQVYTSTEFPADQSIPLHHEMSYSHRSPAKIWFYCEQPSTEGGRTPIADDRKIVRLLDRSITEELERKGVMYVRNFGSGADLTWQEAFCTDDKAVVEAYCRDSAQDIEWRGADGLRTRAVRKAIIHHPRTGEPVWFNHAHMFHVSNLHPSVRAALLEEFAPDELPRNVFFGDGTAIPDDVLQHIRSTYEDVAVRFEWRKGDVLMVDNVLASHGREPYSGPRKILVAMAEMYRHHTA